MLCIYYLFINLFIINLLIYYLLNFTLCCSGQLLVCIMGPGCPACLYMYCLFYVFLLCFEQINDDDNYTVAG